MDFTFTEEQRSMAGSCRALLDDMCSAEALRAAVSGDRPSARWDKLAELGLTGVLAPAEAGGMALDPVDFILIAQEIGRSALPDALIEHAGIGVPLLASLGVNEWLARAASGAVRIAVGAACNLFVLDAERADVLLLAAGEEVHLIERSKVQLTRHGSIDTLRSLWSVDWAPRAETCVAAGAAGYTAWVRAQEQGAIYTAAQCVGLAEKMIELAVAYAAERTQFGKPIGSYQALKHQLATVQVKLEFARASIYNAVTRVNDGDSRAFAAVSSAKLAGGDVADLAARTSLQVHGAMGYSAEVDLHIYMKRAWALQGAWGDRNFHARRVQSLLFEGGLALGPDQTFARAGSRR